MKFNTQHVSIVFVYIILISIGLAIILPQTTVLPPQATGDNGRDFYAIQQTSQGAVPYRDYWWVYGPLMPYFYSVFYLILGPTIKSIVMGQALLMFLSGIIFFLILRRLVSPWFALAGTCWLWIFFPSFSYTLNHIGSTFCMILTMYFLVAYIDSRKPSQLFWAFFISYLCILIKANIGLSALAGIIGTAFLIFAVDKDFKGPKILYLFFGSAAVIILGAISYLPFLKSLSISEIRQCLPFIPVDRPVHVPIQNSLNEFGSFLIKNFISSPANFIFGLIIALSFIQFIVIIRSKATDLPKKNKLVLSLGVILIFLIFSFHEFFLSGVAYRTYWIRPFQFLLFFLLIGTAFQSLSKTIQAIFLATLIMFVGFEIHTLNVAVNSHKNPDKYLEHPAGQIYLSNHPMWIETVRRTTSFLDDSLRPNETFIIIPYDPLYYYLTQKKSPTRQTIFFDHIRIGVHQEDKIISEIESNDTKFVLLTNRIVSDMAGMGTFGESHCPKLAEFIKINYSLVGTVGPWKAPAGAIDNHAVRIFVKK